MLNLLEELKCAALNEDFMQTHEIINEIKNQEDSFEYINPILRLMEENPNLDFGAPGPLVHFVELYYKRGYETLLLESVNRKPTIQTIWMINRIINDPNLENRQEYIDTLNNLLKRDDLDDSVMDTVKGFLEYQRGK